MRSTLAEYQRPAWNCFRESENSCHDMPRSFPDGPPDSGRSGNGPLPCGFFAAISILYKVLRKNESNAHGLTVLVGVAANRHRFTPNYVMVPRRVISHSRRPFAAFKRWRPFPRPSARRSCRRPSVKAGLRSCALLARPFVQLPAYAEGSGGRISVERQSNSRIVHDGDGGLLLRRF